MTGIDRGELQHVAEERAVGIRILAVKEDVSSGEHGVIMVVMTLSEFKRSIAGADAPAGLSPALLALWHDARGDWDAAHQVAQDIPDSEGAWIHAYLHRKEGDLTNADYWYRRAGQPGSRGSLAAEWEQIAMTFLDAS
jgi:hypothetical protein